MNYTRDPNQVVFLKDTDIVQDISGNNEAGISTTAIAKNGIASYDLVSAISSTTSADVDYLSGKLSALSSHFDQEKTDNISAIRYRGEVTLSGSYYYDRWHITQEKKLVGLFLDNDYITNPNESLKAGYLFKAVADNPTSVEYDIDGVILHPNDYLFLKRDVASINDIEFDDINIIRDYDLSVKNLSTQVDTLETTVSAPNAGLISKLSTLSVNLLNEDLGTEEEPNELGLIPKISNDLSTLSTNAGLSAKGLSDAITGISDVISADDVGLSAKITSISTDVITADNSLSNKVKNLSTNLLNEDLGTEEDPKKLGLIPELCTTVTATLSTQLTGFISDTETSAGNLSDAITAIRSDVKGGVNYKGHLKLNMFNEPYDLSTYVALLHGGSYAGETITIPDEVKNEELNNGWMYYISLTGNEVNPPPSSYTTNDGIKFVPGNYIIVHAHNTSGDADTSLSSIKVCDIKRENIDIIQVTDSDLVRFQNLNDVSDALCTSTTALVSSISNTLSNALTTHIGDYNQLCTTLSTSISTLSIDVHTTVSSAIDNKVQLSVLPENGTGTPITSNVDKLIINRMSIQQYETLARNGQVYNDQVYVIDDDNQSLFGHDISNVNDIQATSGHINILSVGSLTAADVVQASELNVIGDAGTVNVANVNAANQISVGRDAFVANSNGNVTAKNLSADALSIKTSLTVNDNITADVNGLTTNGTISAASLTAKERLTLNDVLSADNTGISVTTGISGPSLSTVDITATTTTTTTANVTTANVDTVNATTANVTNISATQTTTGTLNVQDSYVVADKLTANNAGLSIDGNLSVKSNIRAGNISAATISATDQIIVDGKLTATNDGITANGKLSTNSDLDVAGNLSVGSTSLSANGLSVDGDGVKTPNLTATTISTQTLTVANSIQLFNDNYGINKDTNDNALNIRTFDGTTDNPKLKINGKLFKQYYAEYLSNDYLSDGYIDSVTVGTSAMNGNTVWGLKFAWNDIAGKDPTFIPLSSLGGIYEGDGRIISIDKTNPNEFKINASPEAISDAISMALSDAFGIQSIKDELSNKVLFKNGNADSQKIDTLTIHKMSLDQYKSMSQDQRSLSTIYVVEDDNIDAFGGKVTNLAEPTVSNDAATKNYVDNEIATLRTDAETSANTVFNNAKLYTDGKITTLDSAVATSVDTVLAEAKDYIDDEIVGLNNTLVGNIDTAKNEAITEAENYSDEALDNKIKYKVGNNDPINVDTLTIHKMALDEYKRMLPEERVSSNIYVVEDDNIDAFGGKVTNLAEPTVSNDAATKNYVDSQITETKDAISGHITFEKLENPANIVLKINDITAASFSYADFVKDSVLDDVALSLDHGTSVLVFSFKSADDDIDPIPVALSSFANLYEAGSYVTLNKKIGDDNIQKINVDYNNLFAAINEDIQTALIGDEEGDTWGSPGYNKPIYLLSAAIKSNIKRSIDEVDLSALYGGEPYSWNNPNTGTPIAALSNSIRDTILNNDIKSTLVGPLAGNTWTQPAEAAPLGQLSSALNTAIRANIVATDLSSLYGDSGDWNSPITNSPLYQLSTALDEKIRKNITSADLASVLISADDWTTPDSNSPLGIVSSNVVNSIKSSITSAELSALFADENEQGSWTAPGIDSPLQQFKVSLSDTYALSNDVSNYVSSVVSDYQLTTDMTAYTEKSLFSSLTAEVDILSISTDDLSDVTTPADISALSSKLNELIEKVNSIKNFLSGIGQIPAPEEPEPEEPEPEEP